MPYMHVLEGACVEFGLLVEQSHRHSARLLANHSRAIPGSPYLSFLLHYS